MIFFMFLLSSVLDQAADFKKVYISWFRWCSSSPSLSERDAWLPGWRDSRWPVPGNAAEIRHSPTQPQPLRVRSGAAVGQKGEEGEGQLAGAHDGKEGREEDEQRRTSRKFRRPSIPKSFHRWKWHESLPATSHAQVLQYAQSSLQTVFEVLFLLILYIYISCFTVINKGVVQWCEHVGVGLSERSEEIIISLKSRNV